MDIEINGSYTLGLQLEERHKSWCWKGKLGDIIRKDQEM